MNGMFCMRIPIVCLEPRFFAEIGVYAEAWRLEVANVFPVSHFE